MPGRPLHLLCVGKLKQNFIREGCSLYLSRIARWRTIRVSEVRDADPNLPLEKRLAAEGNAILQALTKDAYPVILDERGIPLSSVELANFLREADVTGCGTITFIIGGPFGIDTSVRNQARKRVSLSAMTLPHELARLLLLEQLYRAETIQRKIPYHHA